MTEDTEVAVRELAERWATAEREADVAALDALATDDFMLVGPVGFILDKRQWLQRYRDGTLHTASLTWDEVVVRDYGSFAIAIGRHTQRASYQGNSADGQFRATHVVVRRDDRWLLAGIQLSPLGGPPPFARQDAASEGASG